MQKDLGNNITALRGYSSLLLTSDSPANSLQGHALENKHGYGLMLPAKLMVNQNKDIFI